MQIPYTISDGWLELDADRGSGTGPRAIDAAAGLVRFADQASDLALADFRAVAVVHSERQIRVPGVDHMSVVRARRVHSVALVPRRLPDGVAAVLDGLESGAPLPPGISVLGAAAWVADVSLKFWVGPAADSRGLAKAIARLAGLPMVELFGEFPVWRRRDAIDLSLRDWLGSAPPLPDPGPAPPGLVLRHRDGELAITEQGGPVGRPLRRWAFLAGGAASLALAVPLLFASLPAALALVVVGAVLLPAGLIGRKPTSERGLFVTRDEIRWVGEERADDLRVESLEMLRVADSTLVLVGRGDEVRCELASPQAAAAARAAILRHLLGPAGQA